jgi:hypothetical protein
MSDPDEETLVDYLISVGEAVEYGEPWTETTTHEWWRDSNGDRHVRLVMTYHGGGNRGDDDEAEYVRRLLDMGRAVGAASVHKHTSSGSSDPHQLPRQITHVIENGKARRFRYYMPPPEGVNPDGSGE